MTSKKDGKGNWLVEALGGDSRNYYKIQRPTGLYNLKVELCSHLLDYDRYQCVYTGERCPYLNSKDYRKCEDKLLYDSLQMRKSDYN